MAGSILVIPFVITLIVLQVSKNRAARHTIDPGEAALLVAQASHDELAPIEVTNVVHGADELFYWEQPAALWEVETHSQYVGGYSGVSVSIDRGVYARTGGMRGHKESKESLDPIDTGTLYLSDRRLVFSGGRGVVEIPYKKIGAIVPFKDGARVDKINGKPLTFVTGDARMSIVLGRAINRQFAAVSNAEAIKSLTDLTTTTRSENGDEPR
jgi:hypothetical protein